MKKFDLFPKEWIANYSGHIIRVRNSWNRGMKLYVDDICRVETRKLFTVSPGYPVLTYSLQTEDSSLLIEVFCYALFTVKAKIHVDGQQIGGDDF